MDTPLPSIPEQKELLDQARRNHDGVLTPGIAFAATWPGTSPCAAPGLYALPWAAHAADPTRAAMGYPSWDLEPNAL